MSKKEMDGDEKRQTVSLCIISARRNPKTTGGKKAKEPWFVDLVLDVLGVDTALVEGIVGKYDQHKLSDNRIIDIVQ